MTNTIAAFRVAGDILSPQNPTTYHYRDDINIDIITTKTTDYPAFRFRIGNQHIGELHHLPTTRITTENIAQNPTQPTTNPIHAIFPEYRLNKQTTPQNDTDYWNDTNHLLYWYPHKTPNNTYITQLTIKTTSKNTIHRLALTHNQTTILANVLNNITQTAHYDPKTYLPDGTAKAYVIPEITSPIE